MTSFCSKHGDGGGPDSSASCYKLQLGKEGDYLRIRRQHPTGMLCASARRCIVPLSSFLVITREVIIVAFRHRKAIIVGSRHTEGQATHGPLRGAVVYIAENFPLKYLPLRHLLVLHTPHPSQSLLTEYRSVHPSRMVFNARSIHRSQTHNVDRAPELTNLTRF